MRIELLNRMQQGTDIVLIEDLARSPTSDIHKRTKEAPLLCLYSKWRKGPIAFFVFGGFPSFAFSFFSFLLHFLLSFVLLFFGLKSSLALYLARYSIRRSRLSTNVRKFKVTQDKMRLGQFEAESA
jgi:hypothetical protein